MICHRPLSLLALHALAGMLHAQSFVNGNLEGAVGTVSSVIPNGWQAVPYLDPVCLATADYGATPDLTDAFGPSYDNGLMGNPRSGQSYVTGLHAFGSHHEGLKQTVSGFSVGCSYIIGLYQTVSKQINSDAMDPSGGWSVYAENTLIGVTASTYSTEPAVSLNKPWERREVTFTATSTTHVIKFMPTDDDADQFMPNGVRMGIDSVYILVQTGTGTQTGAFLGDDTSICAGSTLLLQTGITNAAHHWQDGSTATSFQVTAPGLYWVDVVTACGTLRDSVTVVTRAIPPVDLGADAFLCSGQSLELEATEADATYEWQDGSTEAIYTVTAPGIYWVDVTTTCGTARDSVLVTDPIQSPTDLGADRDVCEGASLILEATTPNASYLWQDGSTSAAFVVDAPGTYWVEVTLQGCSMSDTVEVSLIECEVVLTLPNIFTPNGDGENDRFIPILRKGIRTMRTTIYSRWGLEVHSTASLDINWSGSDVPDGTYYWIVDYTDERGAVMSATGTVTLLR